MELWTTAYNNAFSDVTNEQFNWKPKADVWSIAECIEHVRKTNANYVDQLNAILNGRYKRPLGSRFPFAPQLFGKMISAFVEPTGRKKTKTFSALEPTQSNYDKVELMSQFKETQSTVHRLLSQFDEADYHRYYIVSPAGKAITYSLRNFLLLIAAHDQRHFHQAERILKEQLS
jgi:uncharacterized damage-inducible protein DinB